MHLIVTRPEDDARALGETLLQMGHQVTLAPLLRIVPREGLTIPDLDYQFAVATSANGIRSLRAAAHVKSIRILTVGPQSLLAAKDAGFSRAEAHGGDVAGLVRHIVEHFRPEAGPVLYLSGAATSGDLEGHLQHAGFTVDRVTLYDAMPAQDLGNAGPVIRRGAADGVLLYSPRTARIWASLVEDHGLTAAAAKLRHYCLSPNVAAALPRDFATVIANSPNEGAMLALLEQPPRTV